MRCFIIAIIAFFITASSSHAEQVTLKCVTSDGIKASDLVIDIAKGVFQWGILKYDIIHVNDDYISAYERPRNNVGGEIWVIDRRTGEYKRGSVGIFYSSGKPGEEGTFSANIYKGTCVKQQL